MLELTIRRKMLWGVGVAIILLFLDRYSYGFVGPEALPQFHLWQILVTGILIAFLVGAILLIEYGEWRMVLICLCVEGFIFLVMNGAYFHRDGFYRLLWGYEHSSQGLLLTISGLVVRIWLIIWGWRLQSYDA